MIYLREPRCSCKVTTLVYVVSGAAPGAFREVHCVPSNPTVAENYGWYCPAEDSGLRLHEVIQPVTDSSHQTGRRRTVHTRPSQDTLGRMAVDCSSNFWYVG